MLALAAAVMVMSNPPIPARISQLAWIQGRWKGEAFGGLLEEEFSLPRGGCILGISRIVKEDDRLIHKEFMEVAEANGSLTYTVTLPSKSSTFFLKEIGQSSVTWELESNPFPRTITYTRAGDRIDIALAGVDAQGSPKLEKLWMQRVRAD